ncbi:hypothetical protein BGI41_04360 [Methanobrevibacter sp. 87.7]|uniref:DUF2119 domain-containing protein n=1 Tax=Methanobrevibacter sp. 87.7 TaxID=387957 RepID=UPI000B5092C4|nr:DUF2119 domain-containing protein [Methanobrevibacter sp. 87.7]OWT33060.1 hypothetical protein BGI41_04360 [Methanobrevibacter sp. 87.7]
MDYFKHIDNGDGPVKLFIGGVHGNEGKTTIKLIKRLKVDDLSEGQFYFYNFDSSPYISTINKKYYESEMGQKIINLIKKYKPDFYTELHCYNIQHYERLTNLSRIETQGVLPLIPCGDYILISSVSPLIRMRYFTRETICKTLEIPCIHNPEKIDFAVKNFNFDVDKSISRYMNLLRLISKSTNRENFTINISKYYSKQVEMAKKFVKMLWGEDFPPF